MESQTEEEKLREIETDRKERERANEIMTQREESMNSQTARRIKSTSN